MGRKRKNAKPRRPPFRRYAMPPSDDVAWRDAGAIVAAAIGPEGKGAQDVYDAVRESMIVTWAINTLAWLENRGHVVYDRGSKLWRLTKSGQQLSRRSA